MSDAEDPIVLRFEDVTYSPGSTPGVASDSAPLFSGLSLELPRGLCTVVMGPSGSGKSTLLRLGAGLIPPDAGTVTYAGRQWDALSDHDNAQLRESMGFSFQNGALWANRSVYQNIELPYEYHRPKSPRQDVRDAVAKAANQAGIQAQLGLRPSQLSLGEQKLISVARALVMDPQVLFLDDPTGGLDAQATDKLLTLFNKFRQEKRTLIVVTQDPTVTAMIADRLLVIKAGTVLAHGPFSEVTKLPDREVAAILTSLLSQAATFSGDILDLLSIDHDVDDGLE